MADALSTDGSRQEGTREGEREGEEVSRGGDVCVCERERDGKREGEEVSREGDGDGRCAQPMGLNGSQQVRLDLAGGTGLDRKSNLL